MPQVDLLISINLGRAPKNRKYPVKKSVEKLVMKAKLKNDKNTVKNKNKQQGNCQILAAIAMSFFHGQPQLAVIYGATLSVAVHEMSKILLGPVGLVLTIIGVVICPVTSGDTALRSSRITISDMLNIDQKKLVSRLKLAVPLFLVSLGLTFVDFSLIWRYFAWSQLLIATLVLYAAAVYLIEKEKNYLLAFIPAIFCTFICIGYILQAGEGLRLPAMISNVISIILTPIITFLFLRKFKKND